MDQQKRVCYIDTLRIGLMVLVIAHHAERANIPIYGRWLT